MLQKNEVKEIKEQTSRRKRSKASVIVPALLYLALYAGTVIAGVASTQINRYNWQVGDVCEQTITAPYDFVDEYSTNLLREEEMQKVQPVYKQDADISADSLAKLDEAFTALENARVTAKQIFLAMQTDDMAANYVPGNINWDVVLTNSDISKIRHYLPDYMTDQDIYTAAAMTQEQLTLLKSVLASKAAEELEAGIIADDFAQTMGEIAKYAIDETGGNASQEELALRVLSNSVSANLSYDAEATETAKEAAAEAVENIEYKTGENIVIEGERITQKQYEIISQLGLTASDETMAPRWAVGFIVMGLVFGAFILYCSFSDRRLILSIKNALSITLLSAATIGISLAAKAVSPWILPVFLPVIVATAFLKPRTALAYAAFMSVSVALVLSEGSPFFFSEYTVIRIVAGLTGSVFAVVMLQKRLHRGEYILSGLYAGLVNGAVVLTYVILNQYALKTGLFVVSIGVANGLVCGLLSVGVLPIWENLFSLDTPSKLLEIASPGNELLKNLMVYAPGTYHHSLMVANLAEAGVSAVGGNALLARVSSYYHDIGKLQNPNMFSENQINIPNPHDELTPEKSAEIIITHVKQGKIMAEKNKLPRAVIDIIAQHHGDSLVGYFYHAAKQAGDADQKKFRYPGPKPQSKEAGVVMLADTVEAAIRANNTLKNGGDVEEQIDKLIKAKYDDGQLDECPLNRKDLTRIKEAFLNVFTRANHERVVYPEDED